MIFMNVDFIAQFPCVSAKRALRIMNIFSCTAHAIEVIVGNLLDRILNVVDMDLVNLTSIDLCNLLLCGNPRFPFETNRSIIELTVTFIKSTKRFEQL